MGDSYSAAWARRPVPGAEGAERQDGFDPYLRIHAVRVYVRDLPELLVELDRARAVYREALAA